MKFKLQPYSIHELGQRQNQEDSMFPAFGKSTDNDRLFILCDGMGGHEKGEVASATVCETMSNTILSRWNPNEPLSDELLLQAIEDAYDALDEKDNGEAKKMGTTMTFVCFHADGVTVAHIGDSRVYQLRPATKKDEARIMFRTQDHSLVNDLIKIGEITEEEAKNHPQKNVITRAMQPCQERRAKADIAHLTDVQDGDYFFMCSDGMLEEATDENLLFIITNPKKSDKEKVEMLRSVTEENKDNHTAHLIHINKVEGRVSEIPTMPKISRADESFATGPRGVLVKPIDEKPYKKFIIPVLCAVLVLVIICILMVMYPGDKNEKAEEEPETEVTSKPQETIHSTAKPAEKKEENTGASTPSAINEEVITTKPAEAKEEPASEAKPASEGKPTGDVTTAAPQKNPQSSTSKFLNKAKDSQKKEETPKTEKK